MDPAIATIISFLLVSDIIIASGFSLSTTHLTPQNVKSCMFCLLSWFPPSISILTQHVSPGEDFLALLHLPHYGKWPLIRAFCRSLSSVFYLADSAVRTNPSYPRDPIWLVICRWFMTLVVETLLANIGEAVLYWEISMYPHVPACSDSQRSISLTVTLLTFWSEGKFVIFHGNKYKFAQGP